MIYLSIICFIVGFLIGKTLRWFSCQDNKEINIFEQELQQYKNNQN